MYRSVLELAGAEVVVEDRKGRRRPIGRVGRVAFDPTRAVVAGYVVERPRLFMLIDRPDRLLARDRAKGVGELLVVTDAAQAWDRAAEKRLGLEWADTVIWLGMPVASESGTELGRVRDVAFDLSTGAVNAVGLTGGIAADAAIGVRDLPAALVIGYADGAVRVRDAALDVGHSGGAAAAAGKGAAVAKARVSEAAEGAVAAAKVAAAYGRSAAKVAANSDAGKKARGWLKALKDEVVDAMGDPDDE